MTRSSTSTCSPMRAIPRTTRTSRVRAAIAIRSSRPTSVTVGQSRRSSQSTLRACHETFGLATTVTNCSNNYGPWQHPEKVIALFTTSALDDEPLPLYRQSANRREWLHVDDHCAAIEAVILRGQPGATYNVGS